MVPTRRLPLCRCAVLAFRSFSPSLLFLFSFLSSPPPLALFLSFSVSLSSSRSWNFSLYDVARYVRTDATRRAKNGLAAAWWPFADAVIVSFAPMSMSTPSFTSAVRRRAATRSSGMFATWGTSVISQFEGRSFIFFLILPFLFFWEKKERRFSV